MDSSSSRRAAWWTRVAGRGFDSAEHALMEVAELLSAKSRGAATDSGDLNVSAIFEVWHRGPLDNFLVVAS